MVEDACQSQQFWAYARMVHTVGRAIDHIMFWCEACPCHGHDKTLQGKLKHSKKGLFARIGRHSCPLATRRAPECAAGDILRIFQEGLQSVCREVLLQSSFLACGEEERQLVSSDCSHAKRYCMLVASLKFSHWEQLPWVLMGVAHHCPDTARRCAARALQLYTASGPDATQHPVSRFLCSPGSQGRAEMEAFIAGQTLPHLPLLRCTAAKYKFVSICERWIESRHALVKRQLRKATHVSAQHVAFAGCQPMLRELLLQKPLELNQLISMCQLTRSPLLALKSVNLHYHPVVRRLMLSERARLGKKYRPWVVELLDRETLFQPLPMDGGYVGHDDHNGDDDDGGDQDGGHPPDNSREELAPSGPVGSDSAPESGPQPGSSTHDASSSSSGGILHDALWCKYAVEHLRHFIDEQQEPSCQHVFTLGPRLASNLQHALSDLSQCVNPSPQQPSIVPALEDFDLLEPCSSQQALQDTDVDVRTKHGVLVFTITSKNPSHIKVPRFAPRIVDSDALAVSTVQVVHVDKTKQQLFLKLGEEQTPVVLKPSAFSIDDFSTLRVWQGSGALHYSFGLADNCEFTDRVQVAIRSLMKGKKFHPDKAYRLPPHMDPQGEKLAVLRKLKTHDLVYDVERDAWTEWRLTELGLQRLQTSESFQCPLGFAGSACFC